MGTAEPLRQQLLICGSFIVPVALPDDRKKSLPDGRLLYAATENCLNPEGRSKGHIPVVLQPMIFEIYRICELPKVCLCQSSGDGGNGTRSLAMRVKRRRSSTVDSVESEKLLNRTAGSGEWNAQTCSTMRAISRQSFLK